MGETRAAWTEETNARKLVGPLFVFTVVSLIPRPFSECKTGSKARVDFVLMQTSYTFQQVELRSAEHDRQARSAGGGGGGRGRGGEPSERRGLLPHRNRKQAYDFEKVYRPLCVPYVNHDQQKMKSRKVSMKAWSTSALLSFKGQVTKQTAVKPESAIS